MNVFLSLVLLCSSVHLSLQYNKDSCISPYCICEGTSLICDEFNEFSQLDFRRTTQSFSKLVLNPKFTSPRKLNIDSTLNLSGLKTNANFMLVFHHINQIDVRGNGLFQNIKNLRTVEFIDSNLYFYYGSSQGSICSKNSNANGLFENLSLDKLEFLMVKFENRLCPGLLQNSNINTLFLKDSDFNQAFETTAETMQHLSADSKNTDFNININHLKIANDESYLGDANRFVFKNTHGFDLIAEKLTGIHDHFFYTFKQLRVFQLYKADLNKMFAEGPARWLKGLNSHTMANLDDPNVNLAQFENVLRLYIHNSRQVDLSDANFCQFASFPHKHLVFFLSDKFFEQDRVPCTCTVYWLYKYYNVYKNFKIDHRFTPQHCLNINDLSERIDACDLDTRVKQCKAADPSSETIEGKTDAKSNEGKNTVVKATSTALTTSFSLQATILLFVLSVIF